MLMLKTYGAVHVIHGKRHNKAIYNNFSLVAKSQNRFNLLISKLAKRLFSVCLNKIQSIKFPVGRKRYNMEGKLLHHQLRRIVHASHFRIGGP